MADDARRVSSLWVGVPMPVLLAAGVLFGVAQRADWTGAWLLVGTLFVARLWILLHLERVTPALMRRRRHMGQGTKPWDRVWLVLHVGLLGTLLGAAGLDVGHYQVTLLPLWAAVPGLLLMALGLLIGTRAMATNLFFETTVRIQEDVGHRVIDTGPYAVVRHPGYVAAMLVILGAPLVLGSGMAMIPAGLASLWFVPRTWLEDRTLREELDGYADYACRVRFRLLPGLW